MTDTEIKDLLYNGMVEFFRVLPKKYLQEGELIENIPEIVPKWESADNMFVPDEKLISRLEEYEDWCESRNGENPGELMEELAFLAFRCLKGHESIKSYRSYAQQHDLVISGSTAEWALLMTYLHLPTSGRVIVVEAKNEEEPIKDQQFSRLCAIIQNKFVRTSHLGVFFSRKGASGFPRASTSHVSLKYSRATQIIFHARTNKFVVVLDDMQIRMLKNKGSLVRLLEAKIREVEEAPSVALFFDEDWREVVLPSHLSKYRDNDP